MYNIEKKSYGVKITFSGFIQKEEMMKYKEEMQSLLPTLPSKFGILMNMQDMKPLPADSQDVLNASPELIAARLTRSVTLVKSALVTMQSKRLAKESQVSDTKRYLDATKTPEWEQVAENWIVHGIDPER